MIDIFSKIKSQQLMWLKRYFVSKQVGWKIILSGYLNKIGGLKLLLQCNFDIKRMSCHIPKFYMNILETWSELIYSDPDTDEKISNQVIWNNTHIRVNNKSVFYKSFFDAGIITIGDLYDIEGKVRTFDTLGIGQGGNIDFLKWCGIIHAIPNTWRIKMSSMNVCLTSVRSDVIGCTLCDNFVPLVVAKSKQLKKEIQHQNVFFH